MAQGREAGFCERGGDGCPGGVWGEFRVIRIIRVIRVIGVIRVIRVIKVIRFIWFIRIIWVSKLLVVRGAEEEFR